MFDSLRQHFELILIVLFIVSAVCYLVYRVTFCKQVNADIQANSDNLKSLPKKERKNLRHNILSAHLNSGFRKTVYFFADLFWVLLFVVVVRSFLYEPFVIPSSSMKPGLQINDIVLVNKYNLGLRLPITNARLTDGEPIKRGDVLVFKYPNNPTISYIKRVIGLPGDKVYYDNRNLIINNKAVTLTPVQPETDTVEVETAQGVEEQERQYTVYDETLPPNMTHTMRYDNRYPAAYPSREWVVPEGKYLMMGDNRDYSADGRDFGYLDDSLIIGRATRIALNFDCFFGDGKCDRFFKKIQ